MVRFFQKLKAKKGFTLVELIVVIAIIGVLAAILIPTMLGYVTSSRVTSADTTASQIKNNIDNFLTDCDTADYGMLRGSGKTSTVGITIAGGTWTITNGTAGSFRSNRGMSWTGGGSGTKGATKSGITNVEQLLAITLADLFPEIQSGSATAFLVGGKCVAVAWTADTPSGITAGNDVDSFATDGWANSKYAWDTHTAGVSSTGYIIGTAPKLPIG